MAVALGLSWTNGLRIRSLAAKVVVFARYVSLPPGLRALLVQSANGRANLKEVGSRAELRGYTEQLNKVLGTASAHPPVFRGNPLNAKSD